MVDNKNIKEPEDGGDLCKNIDRYPEDSPKYDKMGVTPLELYYRQNGLCWLELSLDDNEDGISTVGELFCTDGKDYAVTSEMLNPTFECAVCMTKFLKRAFNDMYVQQNIDKTIMLLLTTIGKEQVASGKEAKIAMTNITFDFFEEFIKNTTLSSEESKPIKITTEGELILFGIPVIFDASLPDGIIEMYPSRKAVKVY